MSARLTLRRETVLLLALLLLCGFFAVASPAFLSARNLSLLVIELGITATLALGMLLVLLPGHIDLSAGSGVGLIGGIGAVLITEHQWPAPVAMLAGFGAALLIWFAMGALIVRQRIPAFIITLGGLLAFRGLFWMVIGSKTIPVAPGGQENFVSRLTSFYLSPALGYVLFGLVVASLVYGKLRAVRQRRVYGLPTDDGELTFLKLFIAAQLLLLFVVITNQFRGVPLAAVILGAVAFAVWVLTQHTPFGRYLYAIGGNEEAAVISGVPVQRITIGAFTLTGLIVALAGFMQLAYAGSSTTTMGEWMELDAVAACVIGGVSLRGGRGTVLGVLFGALIIACLINGMTLMAMEPEKKFIARGVVLILAVWLDVALARSRGLAGAR